MVDALRQEHCILCLSFSDTSISKSIKYWFRLLKQPDNFWSKKAYNMSLGLTRIKAVLCNNGFEQVWLFGCGQEGPFFKELRERLYSSFCHGWVNHMESSTRFSIYRQLKHCFERENYVDVIWINIYRNALAQIRVGVSQINTHKYQYSKLSEEVNCPFCENTPESEIHFLLHCPVYRNLRTRYLVNYNRNISD